MVAKKNQCLSTWKGVINSYYYKNGKRTGNSVGAKCWKTPDELSTNQLVTSGWLFCLVPSNWAQRWFCLHLLALAPVVKHLGRIRSWTTTSPGISWRAQTQLSARLKANCPPRDSNHDTISTRSSVNTGPRPTKNPPWSFSWRYR